VPELTLAHAQMLLPVPVKGLGSTPAPLVDFQDSACFALRAVGDQNLARFGRVSTRPKHQDTYGMVDLGDADRLGEIPLGVTPNRELRAHEWGERLDPGADSGLLRADYNRPIGFQVADICPPFAMDVVHDWRVGEVAVEGEVAGNGLSDHPIN